MAWTVSLMCSRRPRWRASARQFLRCAMPCSTRIRREECASRWRSYISSYQSRAFLLELAVRCRHHASAGLYAQPLVAGIGEDLDRRPTGQELHQPQLACVGDVRATPGLGRAAPQHVSFAVRDHHALDGVLLVLDGDELVPVLASLGRPPDPDLGAVDDAGLPCRAEMVDDFGQSPQPYVGADGAPSLGEQGPHLVDGPGDGGAVHAKPAGQHVVGSPVTEMDESGRQPVDEHQPVLHTSAHGPLARPGGKPGPLALAPQRPHFGDEFSDHIGRQARHPPVADEQCTSRVPHHATMINDQGLDVSPPTMHELASRDGLAGDGHWRGALVLGRPLAEAPARALRPGTATRGLQRSRSLRPGHLRPVPGDRVRAAVYPSTTSTAWPPRPGLPGSRRRVRGCRRQARRSGGSASRQPGFAASRSTPIIFAPRRRPGRGVDPRPALADSCFTGARLELTRHSTTPRGDQ